jgi:hypothetical protein
MPCLSCLLSAGRHQELLDLIETAPYLWWHYRRYGGQALAAQGRTDEAIAYAEQSLGLNDGPSDMARTCEEILLAAGRGEDAYGASPTPPTGPGRTWPPSGPSRRSGSWGEPCEALNPC